MMIKLLEVFEDNSLLSKISFSNNTLVFSEENSKGKTSLIRLILHSLLFNVSSTTKLNFNSFTTIVSIEDEKNKITKVIRKGKEAQIVFDDNESVFYNLSNKKDLTTAQSVIFEIDNVGILHNLLGCFYIDQDIGWSVTNQGLVAKPQNSFSLKELVSYSSSSDQVDLIKAKIKKVDSEIAKYSAIHDIYAYKKSGDFLNDRIPQTDILSGLLNKKAKLESQLNNESKIFEAAKKSLDNDESFKSLIENMRLIVRHGNNEKFVLKIDDINGFEEHYDMLRAKCLELSIRIKELKNEIKLVDREISNNENQLNIKELSDEFINKIPSIESFDQVDLNGVINQLKNQKKSLRNELNHLAVMDTKTQVYLQNLISKYAERLGVADQYNTNTKGLFFNRENSIWSGAVLSKIVVAYRCACVKFIEDFFGIKLPIIVDSPGANEMSDDNVELICNFLFETFKNHQIIISSTYNKVFSMADFDKKIILKSMLFEYKDN